MHSSASKMRLSVLITWFNLHALRTLTHFSFAHNHYTSSGSGSSSQRPQTLLNFQFNTTTSNSVLYFCVIQQNRNELHATKKSVETFLLLQCRLALTQLMSMTPWWYYYAAFGLVYWFFSLNLNRLLTFCVFSHSFAFFFFFAQTIKMVVLQIWTTAKWNIGQNGFLCETFIRGEFFFKTNYTLCRHFMSK